MMVNPTTKAEKLAFLLDNSRARAIVLPARKWPAVESAIGESPHLRLVVTAGPAAVTAASREARAGKPPMAPDEPGTTLAPRAHGTTPARFVALEELLARHAPDTSPPPKRHIDLDLAALLYTSGSTGTPKGVMLTHRNMVSASLSIISYLENTADDVILNVLPLSFGYGLYQVLMAARFGGTVVLEPSFAYPHAVLARSSSRSG